MRRNHARAAALGICCAVLLSARASGAYPNPNYTARGIFAWVKTSSQKTCLATPYGIIKNNCTSLAEVDIPLPYDFGDAWHQITARLWRSGTAQPFCQALGVGSDGSPEVIGALVYANGTGWNGIVVSNLFQAPSGGSFVACWLNQYDNLDSVTWRLSGVD